MPRNARAAAVPPDDYWPAVSAWCARNKVLLVADEVMTGFGRTGTWFGANHWSLQPDLLLAAKGVTSGYWPLYRYKPTVEEHAHPFQLDSAAPSIPLRDFALKEARFSMLARSDPDRGARGAGAARR